MTLEASLQYIDGLFDIVYGYYHRQHPMAYAMRDAWKNPARHMLAGTLEIQVYMYFQTGRIYLEPPALTRS